MYNFGDYHVLCFCVLRKKQGQIIDGLLKIQGFSKNLDITNCNTSKYDLGNNPLEKFSTYYKFKLSDIIVRKIFTKPKHIVCSYIYTHTCTHGEGC